MENGQRCPMNAHPEESRPIQMLKPAPFDLGL